MLCPEAFVLSPIARFFNLSDRRNLLRLAIFDLDDTLIAGDSDHAWGAFLVAKGLVDGEDFEAQNNKFYQQYQAGCLAWCRNKGSRTLLIERGSNHRASVGNHDRGQPSASCVA